jgi:signal transduction histidine kinase
MNAVLGMADMLAESDLTGEQRRYLDIMRSNGATLLDLINDILDLARVESGQLRFEEVDFDIRELIDQVTETIGMRAHEKHLELAAHVAFDVPHNLVGAQLRLRQVIVNLLSNAVKFTERGRNSAQRRTCKSGCGDGNRVDTLLGDRHGHRNRARQNQFDLWRIYAGRFLDDAKVWR